MIVCLCKAVSDRQIRNAIGLGHTSIKALARHCGAGTGNNCGGCHESLRSMLRQHGAPACTTPAAPSPCAARHAAPACPAACATRLPLLDSRTGEGA